ncbi:Transmembrane domain-containing protein [Spironucleus salmonicida]|uniref:Transmembrane domain-containing protein n=1 Tax=Spironucleus salmonicida TaxID=348837 RepID=V6LSM7_9EUKA|nr:Transmembrane domain-containing protein [Spironucleus salmonicida]|eukprot:EST47615.1 Transmembrane domain-containing protein [Spironucleus salmonicida]
MDSSFFLLKYCPPLRKIFTKHFVLKFLISLIYTTGFSAVSLLILPSSPALAQKDTFVKLLTLPFISNIIAISSSSYMFLPVTILTVLIFVPIDTPNFVLWLISGVVFVKFSTFSAERFTHVDYHYSSRSALLGDSVKTAFKRTFPHLLIWQFLKQPLSSFDLVAAYALLLFASISFAQPLFFGLLYEPVKQIQNDPIRLATISANLSCYLAFRADNNLKYHNQIQELQRLQKEKGKKAKLTEPRIRLILTSRADSFVISQTICAIQHLIQTDLQGSLNNTQQLVSPAIQLAEKLRSLLPPQNSLTHLFEANVAAPAPLHFFLDFLTFAATDSLSRSFIEKQNSQTIFRINQLVKKLNQVYSGETVLKLNQMVMMQENDDQLEFDQEQLFGFGVNGLDMENDNETKKSEFNIISEGRKKIKLTPFQFVSLYLFSNLTFDQLINDPDAIQTYLQQKAILKLQNKTNFMHKLINILTFKQLRHFAGVQASCSEDLIALRFTLAAVSDVCFGLRGNQSYYLSKEAGFEILKCVMFAVLKSGRKGKQVDQVLTGVKIQMNLMRE